MRHEPASPPLALGIVSVAYNRAPSGRQVFRAGVFRLVLFIRRPGGVTSCVRFLENVHLSPVALLDDCLRPWVAAVVPVHGRQRLLSVVDTALWDRPGYYAAGHLASGAGIDVGDLDSDARAAVASRCVDERGYSFLIPHGAIGLGTPREALLGHLDVRCFDPVEEVTQVAGFGAGLELADLYDPLCASTEGRGGPRRMTLTPGGADLHIATDGSAADLAAVIDRLRDEAEATQEIMHVALFRDGSYLSLADTVTAKASPSARLELAAYEAPGWGRGATLRYRIPTGVWWNLLTDGRHP